MPIGTVEQIEKHLRQNKELGKNKKETEQIKLLLKEIIKAKEKSIEYKKCLLELMDMIIINRMNMIEEIGLIEGYYRKVSVSNNVSELIAYFEGCQNGKKEN
ncbi:hypothetical protein NEAUS04_1016 [Nematocida ausubeli]|uniref:Uncharacterized protein n=1 Tax=Nematocida ausubeli (strain ATCC PRA-371 / ERTm2) TaxID=1913371 RepID=H8ZEA5_NEMA1|nr:uncharacterized protein NESG_01731 [Nematocida ausubeli]EHY64870.1 hypothetical protein NERG_01926 [Nematocida ausubeli]KAI5132877.1 hypothetical protein NEAUS06_0423 [Nematocida ausubeli]KAI5135496.1 hypothetical protein NEAUS07_1190 [Nematocida ausubeli]KAI5148280.1 hypothetical protein NEAUS05_1337 [Nematocida ausubeli]KAI5162311.1 hypothetical protein NEAUS04_1016 [Nematocida ausubeli]